MSDSVKNTQERMDIRLAPETKIKLKKAATLAGFSLSEFVVRAAEVDADRILSESTIMTLERDVFDRFTAACESASKPNAALRRSATLARARGIE